MALVATVLALLIPAPAEQRYASGDAPTASPQALGFSAESAVQTARSAGKPKPKHRYRGRHKGCHTHSCDRRMDRKVRRRVASRKWAFVRPHNAWLNSTAACESGGRWFIATGNGFYGGLQFTLQSWHAVGGSGYPHQNSILEQKYRGVKLLYLQGRGAWPVCG